MACFHSECCNKNVKPECPRIRGGGSISATSICFIDLEISSIENGMLESSSSKNELLTALLESSVIITLMLAITSEDTLCVPYLSSQYIVLIRYNCCMLSTGQRSLVISLRVFLGFWCMTRKPTACLPRIRVLDGAVGTPDRIVLISGKEEIEATLSPAMDAAIRVFKRVSGLPDNDGDAKADGAAFCSIRLLVASSQAINLIGKQGSSIKSLQENTGASVRVLSEDEVPSYVAADERIVELQGESMKVLKALEAVVGHLRKFLVDHSVLPLFEKTHNAIVSQDLQAETWAEKSSLLTASQSGIGIDIPVTARRDSLYLEHEKQLESRIPSSGLSFYGQDPALTTIHSNSGLARSIVPIITQVVQTMQIPFSYAEDIIGIGGANIAHIRRTSGAVITVQESMGPADEIIVEIKGSSSQVQLAQQLIQEFISNHKDPVTSSSYRDTSYRSSFPQLSSTSSVSAQPYGRYGGSSRFINRL